MLMLERIQAYPFFFFNDPATPEFYTLSLPDVLPIFVDGTGGPSRYGDVAVQNGTIVSVGKGNGADAKKKINADGMVLAPGFIDPHTHYDAQVAWDPDRKSTRLNSSHSQISYAVFCLK